MLAIGDEVFTAPEDHLGNAAFARTMIGHLQAVELQQLADYARTHEGDEFAYLEVATELHLSGREAQRRMAFAVALTERLPQTLAALKQGWVEEFKARLIADAVAPLSDEHAHAVEAAVLDKAAQQTPGQLRNRLAKAVLTIDPDGAEQRRKVIKRDRRVDAYPTAPGQAVLAIHSTSEESAAMHAAITVRAREMKTAGGETRTIAQLEVDIARDLLLSTGLTGGRAVEVHLTIPATSAVGADDQPGEVDGLPVTAQAAREMFPDATRWRWVSTDPTTGAVVDVTSARYTPPAMLHTLVKVRDRTCRFPGVYPPGPLLRRGPPSALAARPDLRHQLPLLVPTPSPRQTRRRLEHRNPGPGATTGGPAPPAAPTRSNPNQWSNPHGQPNHPHPRHRPKTIPHPSNRTSPSTAAVVRDLGG